MASEHKADEAGGEAIFSSDGLPSLSLPPPPINGIVPDDGISDAVVEESINTLSVFESFVVKSDVDKGWGVFSSDGSDKVEKIVEVDDPRRKLFRLKAEIDELEVELSKQNAGEEYTKLSAELKGRLEEIGLNSDASLEAMLRGRQEDLSGIISRDLEKFAAADSSEKRDGEKGKIIYELYKSQTATSAREVTLEERLRRLEMAVGSSSGEGVPLFERVEEAVKLAKEVDAREVEKVAAKAKVIRSDLEAAARAKTKLSNNALTTQDAQTISSLHDQLVQLEGISSHLPALTSRLVELSNLHSNAAEFGGRLDAVEETLAKSEVMMSNLEEALRKMEESWKVNREEVEMSVKRLDDIVSGKR